MGSIKDRNGMDLTEAEDTKKRWQKYTEELYKKELNKIPPQRQWLSIIAHEPEFLPMSRKDPW